MDYSLCSNCFTDQGLRLDSEAIGFDDRSVCPQCGSTSGRKLSKPSIVDLAQQFFVRGTLRRSKYGGSPLIQFNQHHISSVRFASWLESDVRLIERAIGIGFFSYAPPLWALGEIKPLKDLQDPASRIFTVRRMLQEYPTVLLKDSQSFYRLRKDPTDPGDPDQYDSPPPPVAGTGRLDSIGFPVMYGSQDLQVCVHECRTSAEDSLYVATLQPTRELRLIDLTELMQESANAFDSLDLATNMLFLAGKHSYDITREIAKSAQATGYDGIVYPSYFSLLRTGGVPFETAYGLPLRQIPSMAAHEKAKIIGNFALFGRPIEEGSVAVRSINKLILNRVEYAFHFGPASIEGQGPYRLVAGVPEDTSTKFEAALKSHLKYEGGYQDVWRAAKEPTSGGSPPWWRRVLKRLAQRPRRA